MREGHFAYGAIELWSYEFPLNAERAARLDAGIRAIPKLLEQAKRNVVGDKGDLWTFGTKEIKQQSADLERLASRVGDSPGTLKADVQRAKEATDAFAAWLDAQTASKRAPSGVGVENYNWYLKNNIFITRTEGHATGWEEMMLQAGMFDARPRSRELIYVLLGQRAARALGDLKMHANQFSLEDAARFAAANTPRGWLRLDANTVRSEQHLYLQQPAYGTSYIIGKIQIEGLLAARRRQLGDGFTMKRFMDELNAIGLIPAALVQWEMTGEKPPHLTR